MAAGEADSAGRAAQPPAGSAARSGRDGARVPHAPAGVTQSHRPRLPDGGRSLRSLHPRSRRRDHLRGEFYTAYTPYQPEASQGSLQTFFEYPVADLSPDRDGCLERQLVRGRDRRQRSVFMAMRCTNRHGCRCAGSVNPEFRQILRTYTETLATEIIVIPATDGVVDPARVAQALNRSAACLVIQQPNFFGAWKLSKN